LAYFDRPGTSNGPTEAINGRLENLRGNHEEPGKIAAPVARSRDRQSVSVLAVGRAVAVS